MKYLKHKVILKTHQKIVQRTHEASFIYNPIKNEAIFVLEKIYMKLKVFSKEGQISSNESIFIYKSVQNEVNLVLEKILMKLEVFLKIGLKYSRIQIYIRYNPLQNEANSN